MPNPSIRFLSRALLLAGIAVAVGIFPLCAWAGGAGLRALLLAAGAALVGAFAGRIPRRWILRAGRPEGPVLAALAATGIRMLVTASLALALILAKAVPPLPFAVTLVALYLAFVVLEVRDATKEASRMDGVSAP